MTKEALKDAEVKKIYQQNLNKFEQLRTTVFGMVQNALKSGGLEHLQIQSRVKTEASSRDKIAKKGYQNPIEEMTDWVAFRIIVYLESDIKKASEALSSVFDVDVKNSVDKLTPEKVNQVGYRSYHLVCSLGPGRKNLPEYVGLSDLKFEIQVRTVLQHAWAEIEHKRNYKGESTLPQDLQRRLMTAAGTLEMLDREFASIAKDAELYATSVEEENENVADDPINAIALTATYKKLLKQTGCSDLNANFRDEELAGEIISELSRFGVNSISELQALINDSNVSARLLQERASDPSRSPAGFYRHIMMISDPDKYFDEAFESNFLHMRRSSIEILEELTNRSDIEQKAIFAGINILEDWEQ